MLSPTGLILTNAHVAEPQAPGLAVAMGEPGRQLAPDPPYLTVELTDRPVFAGRGPLPGQAGRRWTATSTSPSSRSTRPTAGTPVNPDSLHLPYLHAGERRARCSWTSRSPCWASPAWPDLTRSPSPTGSSLRSSRTRSGTSAIPGSSWRPLPGSRTATPAAPRSTTRASSSACPACRFPARAADISWRLRSVAEARPLITAARDHTTYHSKILVQLTGAETVAKTGVAPSRRLHARAVRRPRRRRRRYSASTTPGFR